MVGSKFVVTESATATPDPDRAAPATVASKPTITLRGRAEREELLGRRTVTTSPGTDSKQHPLAPEGGESSPTAGETVSLPSDDFVFDLNGAAFGRAGRGRLASRSASLGPDGLDLNGRRPLR